MYLDSLQPPSPDLWLVMENESQRWRRDNQKREGIGRERSQEKEHEEEEDEEDDG